MADKNLKTTTAAKKKIKKPRNVSFLFVDDRGRVLYFRQVKILAVLLILMSLILILSTGIAIKFTLNLKMENQHLIKELAIINNENSQLREENKAITVKLVDQYARSEQQDLPPTLEDPDTNGALNR